MTGIIPFTSAKTIECGLHYRMSQLDDLQSEILDTDECEYDKLNPKLLEIASAISELVKVNGAALVSVNTAKDKLNQTLEFLHVRCISHLNESIFYYYKKIKQND